MTKKILYLPATLTKESIDNIDTSYNCLRNTIDVGTRRCDGLMCDDCLLYGDEIREDPDRLKNVVVKTWPKDGG